jgi:hypothetical protein
MDILASLDATLFVNTQYFLKVLTIHPLLLSG